MNVGDFHPGERVRYVPQHARGDQSHPDCEMGTVTSCNSEYVFVLFRKAPSKPCEPANLVKLSLASSIAEVRDAYATEVQNWDVVPGYAKSTAERLDKLIELGAPVMIIESAVVSLWKKIVLMQEGHKTYPGLVP